MRSKSSRRGRRSYNSNGNGNGNSNSSGSGSGSGSGCNSDKQGLRQGRWLVVGATSRRELFAFVAT
ncbi:hypothetical protein [Pseudoxanthomonas sp. UTMC 1351]|uniref:hypothetical protein n=1 Tax=Pseudoxanthomonas sp. UTMC 1351 TaxID=2695853 RepID=UPI0034CD7441